MLRRMKLQEFVQNLFDHPATARKAGLIVQAILEARSPRLSDLFPKLPARPDANYQSTWEVGHPGCSTSRTDR